MKRRAVIAHHLNTKDALCVHYICHVTGGRRAVAENAQHTGKLAVKMMLKEGITCQGPLSICIRHDDAELPCNETRLSLITRSPPTT